MNPLFDSAQVRTEQMATSNTSLRDPRRQKLLPDVYIAMGQTAENLATSRGISRQEQDEFAVRSQNLAEKAIAYGFWQREITPVARPDGTIVDRDDGPRAGVTFEAVANLPPVFRPGGTVTAGNCSPLNDGAAALIVFSDRKARDVGITPLARIVSTGVSALSPEITGLGPIEASRQALTRAGMTINDIDLVEINEAFAAQVIPSYQDLQIDIDRLNVHGGAIAVGHPFGMTGARSPRRLSTDSSLAIRPSASKPCASVGARNGDGPRTSVMRRLRSSIDGRVVNETSRLLEHMSDTGLRPDTRSGSRAWR